MERDHPPMLAAHERAHGARAVVGREHAIKGVRRAAALQMAEHDAARLFAGQLFDARRDAHADAAEARRVLAVAGILIDFETARLLRAFGRDDDAELRAALLAFFNFLRDRLHRERDFRDQDHVRAAGDT